MNESDATVDPRAATTATVDEPVAVTTGPDTGDPPVALPPRIGRRLSLTHPGTGDPGAR